LWTSIRALRELPMGMRAIEPRSAAEAVIWLGASKCGSIQPGVRRFEKGRRRPRWLGAVVKPPEVQHHHEVYTQFLWNLFREAGRRANAPAHIAGAFFSPAPHDFRRVAFQIPPWVTLIH